MEQTFNLTVMDVDKDANVNVNVNVYVNVVVNGAKNVKSSPTGCVLESFRWNSIFAVLPFADPKQIDAA